MGDQLTPALAAQYIDVMRARGVASAMVRTPDGELRVDFAPEMAPLPGVTPEAGGWKSPARLDAPEQFDP